MDILNNPIHELEFSVRVYNALSQEKIETIGDLVTFTEQELLRLPNFGRLSLKEVNRALAGIGLKLTSQKDKKYKEDNPEKTVDLKSLVLSLKQDIKARDNKIIELQNRISQLTDNVIYVQKQRDQALQVNDNLFKLMNKMMEKGI